MDISAKYITMCKQAKEIQTIWNPKRGDFWIFPDSIHSRKYFPSLIGRVLTNDTNDTVMCRDLQTPPYHIDDKLGETITWLPRQDQLQDLCGTFPNYITDWYHFILENGQLESMEQLWLAFVMDMRFHKQWNNIHQTWEEPPWVKQ